MVGFSYKNVFISCNGISLNGYEDMKIPNGGVKVVAVVQAPLDVLPASLVCRCPAQLPPQKTDKVPEERLARGESYHHQAQKQPQPANRKKAHQLQFYRMLNL